MPSRIGESGSAYLVGRQPAMATDTLAAAMAREHRYKVVYLGLWTPDPQEREKTAQALDISSDDLTG